MPGLAHISTKHTIDGKLTVSGHFSPDLNEHLGHHTGKHDDTLASAVHTYQHDLRASQHVNAESILAMIKARPPDEKNKIRKAQDRNNEIERLQSQRKIVVNEPDYVATVRKKVMQYKKNNGDKWKVVGDLHPGALKVMNYGHMREFYNKIGLFEMREQGKVKVYNKLEDSCENRRITLRGFLLFVGVPEEALHLAAPALRRNDPTLTVPRTPVHVSTDFKTQVKRRILDGPGSRERSREGHGASTGPLEKGGGGHIPPPANAAAGKSVEDIADILQQRYNNGGKGVSVTDLFRFLTVEVKMRISRQDVADLHAMLDLNRKGYVQIQEVINFLNLGGEYDPDESREATLRAAQETLGSEGIDLNNPAASPPPAAADEQGGHTAAGHVGGRDIKNVPRAHRRGLRGRPDQRFQVLEAPERPGSGLW